MLSCTTPTTSGSRSSISGRSSTPGLVPATGVSSPAPTSVASMIGSSCAGGICSAGADGATGEAGGQWSSAFPPAAPRGAFTSTTETAPGGRAAGYWAGSWNSIDKGNRRTVRRWDHVPIAIFTVQMAAPASFDIAAPYSCQVSNSRELSSGMPAAPGLRCSVCARWSLTSLAIDPETHHSDSPSQNPTAPARLIETDPSARTRRSPPINRSMRGTARADAKRVLGPVAKLLATDSLSARPTSSAITPFLCSPPK